MREDSAELARLDLVLRDLRAVRTRLEQPSADWGGVRSSAQPELGFLTLLERATKSLREVETLTLTPGLREAMRSRMREIGSELRLLEALGRRAEESAQVLAELSGWTGWTYGPSGESRRAGTIGRIRLDG